MREYSDEISIYKIWGRNINIQNMVTKYQYTEYGDEISIYRIW